MNHNTLIENIFNEHLLTINNVVEQLIPSIDIFSKELSNTISRKSMIFWCGNGGSASDALHISAELIGRFKDNRISLPSISLNSDVSALTAIANDYSYAKVFSRQIEGLANINDALVVISTSGKSENIIEALKVAKQKQLKTFALLGKGGGEALNLADYSILIPSNETTRIQECHIIIGHIICEIIEIELGFKQR